MAMAASGAPAGAPAGGAHGNRVLELFRDAPLAARVHIYGRWRLFPFPALLPFLPDTGKVVDLGCGHGLFSFFLSLSRPDLDIYGIDPDAMKIDLAQRLARRHGLAKLTFAAGRAEDAVPPECDLVSIIDVLYLIPFSAQERLLRAAVRKLKPGGRLLIKEMSERPRWKAGFSKVQELISVRLLHLSQGKHFYFRREAEWHSLLGELGLRVRARRLDAGYIHPHLLLIAERKDEPQGHQDA